MPLSVAKMSILRRLSLRQVFTLLAEKRARLKWATSSKGNFFRFIETHESQEDGRWSWTNEDLLPTPYEKRNWRAWNYILFYSSLAMDNWTLGSSLIGVGLNWWQAIVSIFIAQFISACVAALNSRCAEVYHIGYPVVSRSVFGMYGAFYSVGARAVLAIIYYSLKVYVGSSFVVNMLHAVFGHSFTSIPNGIPTSIGITTQQMLAFFLYWLIYIPFAFLRPHQLRWLFTLKMFTMIPAMTGLFIFCMVNTHGNIGASHLNSAVPVSSTGWLFMYGINSCLGSHSPLVTNQPDFSRWARKRGNSVWTQILFWPVSVTISAAFGILSTAAINNTWGLKLWNQWDLLTAILDRYPHSSARFAVFVCATFWAVLVLATNVAANQWPLGADAALLCPRYINMIRGQVAGLILAWAIFPWKIYASAATFTEFLSGYGLFMGGLTGIMIADYFLVRGNVFIEYLYDGKKSNPHYYYIRGWNIQAYIAYLCGMGLGFPGFCGNLGAKISTTARELGYLGWILSFLVSALIYVIICTVWPTVNQKGVKAAGLRWEETSSLDDFDVAGHFPEISRVEIEDHADQGTREVNQAEKVRG